MSSDRRHRAQEQARPHRGRVRQLRLLLDERHAQAVALPQLALVERHRAGDDAEERGLAGAVAADQADVLAGVHRERCAVEERQLAVGELGVGQRQQGHSFTFKKRSTAKSLTTKDTKGYLQTPVKLLKASPQRTRRDTFKYPSNCQKLNHEGHEGILPTVKSLTTKDTKEYFQEPINC